MEKVSHLLFSASIPAPRSEIKAEGREVGQGDRSQKAWVQGRVEIRSIIVHSTHILFYDSELGSTTLFCIFFKARISSGLSS